MSQTIYSVVIFSHRYLDSDSINFKTCVFLAVYRSFWTSSYNTDIKVQQLFNGASTMLNNIFNTVGVILWCCVSHVVFEFSGFDIIGVNKGRIMVFMPLPCPSIRPCIHPRYCTCKCNLWKTPGWILLKLGPGILYEIYLCWSDFW